jgi:hypothetical protein
LSSTPIPAAKSLTLWARLLCPLAALSGLEVHKYIVTPAALPALKSGFVNNPRSSASGGLSLQLFDLTAESCKFFHTLRPLRLCGKVFLQNN